MKFDIFGLLKTNKYVENHEIFLKRHLGLKIYFSQRK